MPDFATPWTPQQLYQFSGTLNDRDEPHQQLSFSVLAGVGAPKPTGGWTKVSNIDRARRKGFTMATGYDPLGMDLPIRFEATVNYGKVPRAFTPGQLEHNIQVLEWMAGRGKLYGNGTHATHGNPPIVQVSSFDSHGNATNLIPPNFHSNAASDIRWLISNLDYDNSESGCVRGRSGDRHRQDIVVSLIEYVAAPGAPSSTHQRQRNRGGVGGYKTYTATHAQDTIAKICIAHGIVTHSKWRDVLAFNRHRLHINSVNHHLRIGTKVHIPKADF